MYYGVHIERSGVVTSACVLIVGHQPGQNYEVRMKGFTWKMEISLPQTKDLQEVWVAAVDPPPDTIYELKGTYSSQVFPEWLEIIFERENLSRVYFGKWPRDAKQPEESIVKKEYKHER